MRHYIKQSLYLIVYVLKLLLKGGFGGRYPYKKRYSGRMAILANGPSLKEILPEIEVRKEFHDVEFTVMNFFAFDLTFEIIKPRFYCLADPMFIRSGHHRYKEVKKLFNYLQEKVDWDMNLYIPKWFGRKQFLHYSSLTNPHIHIVTVNHALYESFECMRNWLYKKNFAMPVVGTVAQLGIYVAVNNGFEEIDLYGVDHNMISSLCVNDKNQLCSRITHFYEDSVVLKNIINADNKQLKVADYLIEIGKLFRSHDLLSDYAKSLDVNIVNYTPESMIDSYHRKNISK